MLQKRGISTIIASVLIVLITVFAVTLLWLGLGTFIDTDLSTFDTQLSIVTSTGYTFYDPVNETLMVQVESSGTQAANYVQMIITLEDGTELISTHYAPFLHSRKTLHLNANETYIKGSIPDTVSVAPIFVIDSKAILGRRTPDVTLGRRSETALFYAQTTNNEPPLSPIGSSVVPDSGGGGENNDNEGDYSDPCSFTTQGCQAAEEEEGGGQGNGTAPIISCFGFIDSGSGYYTICTCEDLQRIDLAYDTGNNTIDDGNNYDEKFILMNDIDCTDTINWNNGRGFDPIGYYNTSFPSLSTVGFIGDFSGNGYTIDGLYINRTNETGVGLFAFVNKVVGTVTLKDVMFTNSVILGGNTTGTLLGRTGTGIPSSSVKVSNINVVNGIVTGNQYVGGLVGNPYQKIEVSSSAFEGNVFGTKFVGGLVGFVSQGIIEDSYVSGVANGSSNVGGLVGSNSGTISRSYSAGSVKGESYEIGGLVGLHGGGGLIEDSYSTAVVTCLSSVRCGGLFGRTYQAFVNHSYSLGNVVGSSPGSFGTGYFYFPGVLSNFYKGVYFDTEVVTCGGSSCSDAATFGRTTANLQNQTFLESQGWNFVDIWEITGTDYPHLK